MAPPAHAWSGGAPGRRPEPARRRRDGVVALQQGVATARSARSCAGSCSATRRRTSRTIYAIAAAAGHPLADDIKAGRIKVDEMRRSAVENAVYVPTGTGGLLKGDTIYVKPTFDVSDLVDRATAIHELEHARQDKAESAPTLRGASELEPEAYVAGGKYTLQQIAALLVDNLREHGRGRVRLSGLSGESVLDLKRGSK